MGVPVTVDSDDLKALLDAGLVLKNVARAMNPTEKLSENAIEAAAQAHDRMAGQYRRALRGDGLPPPTEHELEELRFLFPDNDGFEIIIPGLVPRFQPLNTKGLIEFGHPMGGVKWSNSGDDLGLTTSQTEVYVRLTAKGYAALNPKPKAGTH